MRSGAPSVGTGEVPHETDARRGRRQAAATHHSDRRDQGVETHARLDGQRTQTQRLEDIRNLLRTVDADELKADISQFLSSTSTKTIPSASAVTVWARPA